MTHHTAKEYAEEPVRYPSLHVVDLAAEGASVTAPYANSVFEEAYRWHYHPRSDELFIVMSGHLVIDLLEGDALHLHPWQCVTIPAAVRHRTRAIGRTVNLCVELLGADTVFLD